MTKITDMSEAMQKGIAVIGGGAAGMMAAIHAANLGVPVTVFERNERCGRKLRITGKGRCNVTNHCTRDVFFANIPGNSRFLFSAWSRFDSAETERFFEEAGVPLKVERGNRVFPVSDKATDIVDALVRECRARNVRFVHERVTGLRIEEGRVRGVLFGKNGEERFGAVILATGGASYPLTGSTGDGYGFAEAAGHSIVPPTPSLVPLVEDGRFCATVQGLSLRNVSLAVTDAHTGKEVFRDFGEMLFTHYGLTGPLVLSASAHLSDMAQGRYTVSIDLKPALDEKTLDARLLSDFEKYKNKDFQNALSDLLPQKLIAPLIERSGIDGRKKVNAITREERHAFLTLLKGLTVPIKGFRPIEEAIITKGGVTLSEVDPRTMASKKMPGLYFAGEILDLDAYTGGFNLQIAFSTAVLAGEAAAEAVWQAEA
ncbi:MAG: NAD(P)/FAD-dependent oxidoreductase [Ruminococcaceae bacterium]|nr:NAD(P)/FAD-dependent oxidoreductase [Oscillospiraceae bacterium]